MLRIINIMYSSGIYLNSFSYRIYSLFTEIYLVTIYIGKIIVV